MPKPRVNDYFVLRAKFRNHGRFWRHRVARQIVEDLSVFCNSTGPAEMRTAFRIEDESGISFRDALICASAFKMGAHTVLSEDLNHGQVIAGVRIENPFLAQEA